MPSVKDAGGSYRAVAVTVLAGPERDFPAGDGEYGEEEGDEEHLEVMRVDWLVCCSGLVCVSLTDVDGSCVVDLP